MKLTSFMLSKFIKETGISVLSSVALVAGSVSGYSRSAVNYVETIDAVGTDADVQAFDVVEAIETSEIVNGTLAEENCADVLNGSGANFFAPRICNDIDVLLAADEAEEVIAEDAVDTVVAEVDYEVATVSDSEEEIVEVVTDSVDEEPIVNEDAVKSVVADETVAVVEATESVVAEEPIVNDVIAEITVDAVVTDIVIESEYVEPECSMTSTCELLPMFDVEDKGSALVEYALQFVGNPYVWGGTSLTDGADCSGFTMTLYGMCGIELPHSSYTQASYGVAVDGIENALPGDLIVYNGHVAIYAGDGLIVHAANSRLGICVSGIDFMNLVCIRRLL